MSEGLLGDPSAAKGSADTSDTVMSSHYFTQPCDANIHGKVFGGLLMRQAFELGFSAAWVFTGSKPEFFSLDDITFQRPVELGTLLRSTARVEYTAHAVPDPAGVEPGHFVTVAVSTEVVNPEEGGQLVVTNDFHFTFKFSQAVPRLLPRSYAEAMTWLEGHRRFKHGQESLKLRTAEGGAVARFA
jgi:acyl-coenzyme A thioesterase 9